MTSDTKFFCQCGHSWDRHQWKFGGGPGNRSCEEPGCLCQDFAAATGPEKKGT